MTTNIHKVSPAGRPFRWGTHFKNGKCYVFQKRSVTVIRGWPELRAWRKTRTQTQWRPIRPEIYAGTEVVTAERTPRRSQPSYETDWNQSFPDPMPAEEPTAENLELWRAEMEEARDAMKGWEDWHRRQREQECAVGQRFFADFPADVKQLLEPFHCRQWHLAALLARCPGAADLVRSNPALAWCLASNWAFHQPAVRRPLRAARALIPKRQRDIARWLGFPGTEAVVRILRRVHPACCDAAPLLYLRSALHRPEVVADIGHFRHLTSTALRVIGEPRMFAASSHNLITEMSAGPGCPGLVSHHVRTLKDTLEMWEQLGNESPLPPLANVAVLRARHDTLARRLNRLELGDRTTVRFPSPPIPGTAVIVPLTTPELLLEEGREQCNCVASYAMRVARGKCFIYRVLEPERATLAVTRHANAWRLAEISLEQNRPASACTRRAAESWLSGEGWNPDWQPF